MENPEKSMWLLLLGVGYSLGTIYLTYLGLNFLHLTSTPTTDLAIGGVAATLLIKIVVADGLGRKDFDFLQHGHDLAIMTLGTAVTTICTLLSMERYHKDALIVGLGAMLLSFVGVFITAAVIRTAREAPGKRLAVWKSSNLVAGTVAMIINIGLLWMKTHPEHVHLWYSEAATPSASADASP